VAQPSAVRPVALPWPAQARSVVQPSTARRVALPRPAAQRLA
jgi:hypothetical protein